MNIKIEGIGETIASLNRTESRLIKKARGTVQHSAEKMASVAQEYAPIKDGHLEKSLEILEEKTTPGRYSVTWGVNNAKLGPGYTEGGFPYHGKMHDGGYNLGPRSKEKARAGNAVGPGYVDRAMWENKDEMLSEIDKAISDALK